MCWACDHPGSTYQDQLDHMRELMVRNGWAVQGVEGDRTHPPYAYTLGLTQCGLPELVVTGMSLRRAGALLNSVAAHVVHAEPPAAGEQIPLVGGPLIEIVELAHPDAHLDTAVALFGQTSCAPCNWSGPTTAATGHGSAGSGADGEGSRCSGRAAECPSHPQLAASRQRSSVAGRAPMTVRSGGRHT